MAIMAGASPMSWTSLTLAAAAGSLPPALLYALTGATVATFQSTAVIFGLVLLIAGVFWFTGRLLEPLLAKEGRYNSQRLDSDA
jgi:uncharacterized membrane protein YdjX (TVP38/TMEM64 family)